MIKVEELTFAYIQKFCDFEKILFLTNHFHTDWEADILVINQEGFLMKLKLSCRRAISKMISKNFIKIKIAGEKFLKHDKIGCGDYVCNHFSFLLPMGMVALEEIPQHCGVIEFYHNEDTWKTEFYIRRLPQKFMKILLESSRPKKIF